MTDDIDFDKHRGLREVILTKVKMAASDVHNSWHNDPTQTFDHQQKYCVLFTICLEECLNFGMKESGFFKERNFYGFLREGISTSREPNLRNSFDRADSCILSKDGKARAWIRLCLNQGTLADNLYSLAANRRFIQQWYHPWSVVSTNALNDLHEITHMLRQIHFEFGIRDRELDNSKMFTSGPEIYRAQNNLQSVERLAEPISVKKRKKRKRKKQRREIRLGSHGEEIPETPEATDNEKVGSFPSLADDLLSETSDHSKIDSDLEKMDDLQNMVEFVHEDDLDVDLEFCLDKAKEASLDVDEVVVDRVVDPEEPLTYSDEKEIDDAYKLAMEKAETEVEPEEEVLAANPIKSDSASSLEDTTIPDALEPIPYRPRKNSDFQVMRKGAKPISHPIHRSNSRPDLSLKANLRADEVERRNVGIHMGNRTPVSLQEEMYSMNFRFPEEGRFQQEEEQFEEHLFDAADNNADTQRDSPDFGSDPSFTPERPGSDYEDFPAVQQRDRGITVRDGVEQEFDRRIYADTKNANGWNMPLGLSVQNSYFENDHDAARRERQEQQAQDRKRRKMNEQSVLRDHVRMQNGRNIDIASIRPSTGLILDAPEKISVDQCMAAQKGLCFSCGAPLVRPNLHRCSYTGKIYCSLCMDEKMKFVVPHCLLNSLDYKEHPVSKAAYEYLKQMYSVPAIPLSLVKPQLAERNDRLRRAGKLLQKLSTAREFVYKSENRQILLHILGKVTDTRRTSSRVYLLDSYASDRESFVPKGIRREPICCGMVSMQDFIQLLTGDFVQQLNRLLYDLLEAMHQHDYNKWTSLRKKLEEIR